MNRPIIGSVANRLNRWSDGQTKWTEQFLMNQIVEWQASFHMYFLQNPQPYSPHLLAQNPPIKTWTLDLKLRKRHMAPPGYKPFYA